MSRDFFAALADEHPLDARIAAFNFQPGRTIHPSWLEGWCTPQLLARFRGSQRASRQLDRLVSQRFELDQSYCLEFSEADHRLALLDGDILWDTVFMTGIALLSRSISQTVQRDQILEIRARLGEKAYNFALGKAPFLAGHEQYDHKHHQPEDLGLLFLARAQADRPPGILKRLRLILPKGQFPAEAPDVPPEEGVRCGRLLRKVLLQEVSPQCVHLFP